LAIHSASLTSVLRPGTFLIRCALASAISSVQTSRVSSLDTFLFRFEALHPISLAKERSRSSRRSSAGTKLFSINHHLASWAGVAPGKRLVISSTFEPAEGIDFNYKMHPMPKVLMNGQNLSSSTLGQSVEINNSMYTIYNDVEITEIPIGENIQFHIEYDHLDQEMPINNPWVFDIAVPTEQLATTSETIHFNQEVQLGNGQSIRLDKMIVTPISTVLYYDWPEQANHIAFKIVNESGAEILPNSATISPELSYNRYEPIDLQSEKYYLVPFKSSDNYHATDPGEVLEQSILINP
jgi:hypothetical protein